MVGRLRRRAKLIDAAKREGVDRYVIVSSIGADDPPAEGGDVFGEYLRAKAKADRELEASGLDYTIIRPGMLTDEQPSGLVSAAAKLDRAEIPAPTSPRSSPRACTSRPRRQGVHARLGRDADRRGAALL